MQEGHLTGASELVQQVWHLPDPTFQKAQSKNLPFMCTPLYFQPASRDPNGANKQQNYQWRLTLVLLMILL